ncbi:MAG: ribosome biogenesis GTP-binding protein YihA/YsxC [Eubacteriales bacterium]
MEIKKARFIKSITRISAHPGGDFPEIAVAGKSNVGKSSLINYFCNQRKLAKTSGTPGKTRLVNFFLINENFYLVDLPGYGFAKVSKAEQESWGRMIEDYLINSDKLKAIVILVDIRHNPTRDDLMMFNWAAQYSIPVICVATKADKIAKSKRYNQIKAIKKLIGYGEGFEIYPVSSSEKLGKEAVLNAIEAYL